MKQSKKLWITLCILLVVLFVTTILIFNSHLLVAEKRKISSPIGFAPKYSSYPYDIYETDSKYIVTIQEASVSAEGYGVEFSKDRKCLAYYGIIPIKSMDMKKYLGKDITFLERRLGKEYLNIGSGFEIIGYITADGYLISFYIDKDIVCSVTKFDLFTMEKVYYESR